MMRRTFSLLLLLGALAVFTHAAPAPTDPADLSKMAAADLAELSTLSKELGAELSTLSKELSAQLAANQNGGGTNHLYFYWISVGSRKSATDNQCGQIDGASLVPAELFKKPVRLLLYVQATISLYGASQFKGPQPGELKLGQCRNHGYLHDAHQTMQAQWTPIDLQGPVCEKRCHCQWPAYATKTRLPACTDQPDDPSAGHYCSLCGPNAPGNCGGLSGSACTQSISIWRKPSNEPRIITHHEFAAEERRHFLRVRIPANTI